jgi:hypothetical protein
MCGGILAEGLVKLEVVQPRYEALVPRNVYRAFLTPRTPPLLCQRRVNKPQNCIAVRFRLTLYKTDASNEE